jgi:GT2 family glycosyltransferase
MSINDRKAHSDAKRRVCAIIVTYGERSDRVSISVDAALKCGVAYVVLVDNGTPRAESEKLRNLAKSRAPRIHLLRFDSNLGSAGGFKKGIEYAYSLPNVEFLWLLDDDNAPKEDALRRIIDAWELSQPTCGPLALFSMRERWRAILHGLTPERFFPRRSSFLWFHMFDVPSKLLNRIKRPRLPERNQGSLCRVPYGPYGGMFFHKSLVELIGLPDEKLYLYNDDTEYTYRISRNGGACIAVYDSYIDDLERSWDQRTNHHLPYMSLLSTQATQRVYFTVRNRAYFDRFIYEKNKFEYVVNKWIVLAWIGLLALFTGNLRRYKLVLLAVREGEQGKLGNSYNAILSQ